MVSVWAGLWESEKQITTLPTPNTATLNQNLWVTTDVRLVYIDSHFILISPGISLILPRKCSLQVRAGSFVQSASSRFYFLKWFVQCCKWVALVVCTAGILPWPCQNPFKKWSLNTSFQTTWLFFGLCKGYVYPKPPLKFSPKNPKCPV